VSLIDVYHYYNKMRATCMISPDELLQACRRFTYLGIGLKLSTYEGGIMFIESGTRL